MQHVASFGDLVAAERPYLFRIALQQLGDKAAAEDAVQDALLAALASETTFQGRASVKTWLLSILRHKIIDAIRLRRNPRNATVPIHGNPDGEADFEDMFDASACWAAPKDAWSDPQTAAEQTAFFKVLDTCLTRLPENTSRVFLMREWLGQEPDDICAVLGLSPGNLRVLLYRARMQLRHCLELHWER